MRFGRCLPGLAAVTDSELTLRNRAYLKEEKAAMERFEHKDGKCAGTKAPAGAPGAAPVTTGGGR